MKIIINGGKPLKNSFKNYDEYHKWIDKSNEDKKEFYEPLWGSDCSFKTDFDGPIIHISSRFYPPAEHYGPKWDGTCCIYFLSKEICSKDFKCDTIDELKKEVEKYVKNYCKKLKKKLNSMI